MKHIITITIIHILFITKVSSQNKFDYFRTKQVKGTVLERPIKSDTIKFDIRLWVSNFFYPDIVIRVYEDYNNIWNYNVGYFKTSKTSDFLLLDTVIKSFNSEEFDKNLSAFLSYDIPDQKDINLSLIKKNKKYSIKNSNFFSRINDGIIFTIEIFDNVKYKSITYNNPELYIKDLKKYNLSTAEHEQFLNFTNYLLKQFKYEKIKAIQIMDESK